MILLFLITIIIGMASPWEVENCSSTLAVSAFQDILPDILNDLTVVENYTVVELEPETGAKCLDGTNYKFYFQRGHDEGQKKFIIYFQGSGFCGADGLDVIESCYDRTMMNYGTSNSSSWGENGTEYNIGNSGIGYLSSIKEYNPDFYNWNKIHLISCDGAIFLGSLEEPLYYNSTPIYVRGYNNTMEAIHWLEKNYDLGKASEIIINGGSSGAWSSILWASYLQDYFSNTTKVITIPDAGFFIDTYNSVNKCYFIRYLTQKMIIAFNLNNTDLYRRCKYRETETWKCLLPQYMYKDIHIPTFIMNSQYDERQLTNFMTVECMVNSGGMTNCNETERERITYVREEFLKIILDLKKNKPNWGLWLRACEDHNYHSTWAWYGEEFNVFSAETMKSSNLKRALNKWYDDLKDGKKDSASYIDLIDWLHNPLCHYGENIYNENHF